MNFKTTIVLLVLVMIGGTVWFVAGQRQQAVSDPADDLASETRYVLADRPEVDRVVGVRIERPDKPRIVFVLIEEDGNVIGPKKWRMTEPVESGVEDHLVNGLISGLLNLRSNQSSEAGAAGGVSLADAGLEPPRATFTLNTLDGKSVAVGVGSRVPLSNDAYLLERAADRIRRIHVVSRDFSTEAKRDAGEYRSKRPVQFARTDAVAVEIDRGDLRIRVRKSDGGDWIIEEPVRAYADAARVDELVGAVAGLAIVEFIEDAPEDPGRFGLTEPFATVRVTTRRRVPLAPEDGSSSQPTEPQFETVEEHIAFAIGDYADLDRVNRYVRLLDQPWVASVSEESMRKAVPTLDTLRDNRITRVQSDAVSDIELTVADETVTISSGADDAPGGAAWIGSGDLAHIEADAVRDLLEALEDVHAIDFIDSPEEPGAYGLDAPRAVLRISSRDALEATTLRIGANTASGRNTYVQIKDQPTVMVIDAGQADRLAVDPITLRSRIIVDSAPVRIRIIDRTIGDQTRLVENHPSHARMLEPAGARIDPAELASLIKDLARLRARAVVGRDAFADYGLDRPDVVLRFTLVDEETPADETPDDATTEDAQPEDETPDAAEPSFTEHVLYLATRDGRTFCRRDDAPFVFELDETVVPVLTGELIRRAVFDVDAGDVQRVTLSGGEQELLFERGEKGWALADDPYVRISQEKLDDLVSSIAGLRATRYLAYEGADAGTLGDEEAGRITLVTGDGATLTLQIARATVDPTQMHGLWAEESRLFTFERGAVSSPLLPLEYYIDRPAEPGADAPN